MTTIETTPPSRTEGSEGPANRTRQHALVIGARTALVMLLIAGVALIGLGVVALWLVDPPEVDGLLRSVFGSVFGHMAIALGAIIGVPAMVGVWAMSGANAADATPAMSRDVARITTGIAITALILAAAVVLIAGSELRILDLALIGVVALPTLGLAGAVAFSPHRARAVVSAVALVVLAGGILWMLLQAYRLVQR